ncbi:MAG: hypothetical protein BWZ07_01283 [Alphaproteobacteria bacterium ADurb.BinA280]|nr:MAG: hypothetical protein BWZ07_01283 [Alphaproteobacteria bacterium ADurb.BinA280]
MMPSAAACDTGNSVVRSPLSGRWESPFLYLQSRESGICPDSLPVSQSLGRLILPRGILAAHLQGLAIPCWSAINQRSCSWQTSRFT